MAAYLLGQIEVHDPERFAPYIERTSGLIAEHGGEVLDVVAAVEVLEGTWPLGALTAIVRFPDRASLEAFWHSPGNEDMKELRQSASTSNVVIAESLPAA
jgi:uncharacterized protein (DUF1330 family)